MKTFDVETMRIKLWEFYEETVRIHETNKARGSSELTLSFDAGRADAAKWALEVFDKKTATV